MNILGVPFVAAPYDDLRHSVRALLADDARRAECLCPSGAHGVIEARRDPSLRAFLNSVRFNVPDGMPIVLAGRAMGFRGIERVFGPDVMLSILEDSVPLGTRHFFYGGREGVSDSLARELRRRMPRLQVAGTYCPPFRPLSPAEEDEIVARIHDSGTDVVWIGLSTPKQERWMERFKDRLDVKLLCSVGAAFDYHTGSIRPAPRWMKRAALEWLYRLLQEPRRLAGRYARVVPTFLVLIGLQLSGLRRFPLAREQDSLV